MPRELAEPWRSFLADLDARLEHEVGLHCCGGFVVTVATLPDSYEDRLTELYPGRFRHLRLLALDPYDLVLAKITRNADRDRRDLEYLATAAC